MWVQWICDRTSKSFGKFLWRVHTRLYTYRKQKFDRVEKRTREIMFYRSISCNRSINHANGRVWLARRRLLIMTTKKIDKILFCREIIIGRVHFCCCPTERILTSRLRFFIILHIIIPGTNTIRVYSLNTRVFFFFNSHTRRSIYFIFHNYILYVDWCFYLFIFFCIYCSTAIERTTTI